MSSPPETSKAIESAAQRPVDTPAHVRSRMTGLEYFRQVMTGEQPGAPLVKLLGMRIVELEPGRAVVEVEPSALHENGLGIAHGGLAATLLDTALGCAVNSVMGEGQIFTTLEMKVHFTRAIRRDTGLVRCEASIVHAGRRTATAEGRVVDRAGKIYAHGTGTWIAFDGSPRT